MTGFLLREVIPFAKLGNAGHYGFGHKVVRGVGVVMRAFAASAAWRSNPFCVPRQSTPSRHRSRKISELRDGKCKRKKCECVSLTWEFAFYFWRCMGLRGAAVPVAQASQSHTSDVFHSRSGHRLLPIRQRLICITEFISRTPNSYTHNTHNKTPNEPWKSCRSPRHSVLLFVYLFVSFLRWEVVRGGGDCDIFSGWMLFDVYLF